MALPGHYVMALPVTMLWPCLDTMLWPCLDTMLWPCHATIMALPLCCGPACHYVMAHGAINHSETNISIIESTDKGFPEILSWIIIVSDKMPFGPRPLISFRHE